MRKLTWIVGLMWFAGMCSAADSDELGVALKVGTIGLGVDLSYSLYDKVNLRGGYSRIDRKRNVNETGVSYKAELAMSSATLLLDWHPFANGFRLTGGVSYYPDNQVTGSAVPVAGQTLTVNDVVYDSSDLTSLDVAVELKSFSPYIGVGWGNSVGDGHWSITLDAGFTKVGPAHVGVGYTCIDPVLCASIDADVQAEIAELEDDISDFTWWPVLSIGFAYKI